MEFPGDHTVYLVSTANKTQYRENQNNLFRNTISPSITLDGKWKVALKNIFFKPSFYTIKKFDLDYKINLYVQIVDMYNVQTSAFGLTYYPTKSLIATNLEELINLLNDDFTDYLIDQSVIGYDQPYIFKLNDHKTRVICNRLKFLPQYNINIPKCTWTFSNKFKELLGAKNSVYTLGKPIFEMKPTFPENQNLIFVYSDIVENCTLGNQAVNLLDVLPLNNIYSKQGSLSIYRAVNRNIIDEITLKFTDRYGDLIRFDDSVVVYAVLHFVAV